MWLTDAPLEALRPQWFAAGGLAAQQAVAARLQARALQVSARLPCGLYLQAGARRRGVAGVLPDLPLFTTIRRV